MQLVINATDCYTTFVEPLLLARYTLLKFLLHIHLDFQFMFYS